MIITFDVDIVAELAKQEPEKIIEVLSAVDEKSGSWDMGCAIMDYALKVNEQYRADHGQDYIVKCHLTPREEQGDVTSSM